MPLLLIDDLDPGRRCFGPFTAVSCSSQCTTRVNVSGNDLQRIRCQVSCLQGVGRRCDSGSQ